MTLEEIKKNKKIGGYQWKYYCGSNENIKQVK